MSSRGASSRALRHAWRWLWPLTVAFLVRAARGYRGFPAIDDFAYVPLARAALDPTLYPGDRFLRGFLMHSPIWTVVVGISDRTMGLANGLWIATVALTIATVFVAFRLMRTAGVPAYLLPLFVAIGFAGRVQGIGRGAFDGALGDGFHAQWVALCLLLWCYDAFARRRRVSTGVLLGAAALAHPLVALHGAFVLAVAVLAVRGRAWRDLAVVAAICALVSAPVTLPIAIRFVHTPRSPWPIAQIIEQGFRFRAPSHYTMESTGGATLLLAALLICSAFAAALGPSVRRRAARGRLRGVLLGHTLLLAGALALNGPLAETRVARGWLLPYQLDLTRTTPLALVLAALLLLAAVFDGLGDKATRSARALFLALSISLLTLGILGVAWGPLLLVALVVAAIARASRLRPGSVVTAGSLSVGVVIGLIAAAVGIRRELVRPASLAALQDWARDSTARDALFIVPPGFRSFRLYAERPVFVDYELFPLTSPGEIVEWRRRLELIARPDRLAAAHGGWGSDVARWDRSYATRNTPTRAGELLERTGARYFIWDSLAAEIPPFVPASRRNDPNVDVAYRNERYTVYKRVDDARR